MNDARTMSRSSGSALGAALKRIAASNREPTPWEAGCLYAALCAMAVGDYRTARQKVAWSTLGDTTGPPPVQGVPAATVDELREALANLEHFRGIET
jgi:hypothetical protein